jgi:hypothetical protein
VRRVLPYKTKTVTKTIRNLDWAKVEGAFGTMRPDQPRATSQSSQYVRVQAGDAEIGASTIQVSLLFDPLEVDLQHDPDHALKLQDVTLNGAAVSNVRVRIGGPGASVGSGGQLAFTLSGSVSPEAAATLHRSSMLTVKATLDGVRLLEAYVLR